MHQIDARSCVLFVDDGSKDSTWGVIRALHNEDPELFHGLKLAHNKGHQNALFAGLMHALHSPADVAVSMDACTAAATGRKGDFISTLYTSALPATVSLWARKPWKLPEWSWLYSGVFLQGAPERAVRRIDARPALAGGCGRIDGRRPAG